jgi:hypothetical protein
VEPNKPEHPQNQQNDGDCSKHRCYVVIISNGPLSVYYTTVSPRTTLLQDRHSLFVEEEECMKFL